MLNEFRRQGLQTPDHESQVGTVVRSENHYDQLLFFPPASQADLVDFGVFDYDAVIFKDLWDDRAARFGEKQGRDDFERFCIWAISDHRPLWAQFKAP